MLCLALGIADTAARTRAVEGGLSPDGHIEVVVSCPTAPPSAEDFPAQYDYSIVLRRVDGGEVLFENPAHWQNSFFSDGLQALWSADSRLVALSFEGANHTRLFRLFAVESGNAAAEVVLPDYVHPVLAALDVEAVKSLAAMPHRWAEHTLELSLSGTTAEPRRNGAYDFDFAAVLAVRTHDRSAGVELSRLSEQPVNGTPPARPPAASAAVAERLSD